MLFKGTCLLLLSAAPASAFLSANRRGTFAIQQPTRTSPTFVLSEVESSSGSEVIEEKKEEINDAVADATEVVTEAAEDTAEAVSETATEVAEATEDAVEVVADSIDEVADSAVSAVEEKPEEEKERFSAFVGNLAFTTTFEELKEECSKYGETMFVTIPKDRNTGLPRGFAFVSMKTRDDLEKVIEGLDGVELNGRVLRVVESVPKGEQAPTFSAAPKVASQKLYVGNLSFDTSVDHLKEFFEEIGPVSDIYMPMKDDGTPRGFAFVTMPNEDAEKAINEINGYNFMGRTLTVSKPLPPGEKTKRRTNDINRTKIYVGNLSFQTSADVLAELFEEFGTVLDCYLPEDPVTGSSRGFGFVSMSKEDAMNAIDQIDGCELDGRFLRVNEALARGQQRQEQSFDDNMESDDGFNLDG